jgi:hypothetical protein
MEKPIYYIRYKIIFSKEMKIMKMMKIIETMDSMKKSKDKIQEVSLKL